MRKKDKNKLYIKKKNNITISYDYINGEYYCNDLKDKSNLIPISVCWMIENLCNLDCIYCFAENKNILSSIDYKVVADNILKLDPVTIVLTGGEPTLNPNLPNIIEYVGDKAYTIIDSNGTTNNWEKIIPKLKNSLVRFSIDSLNCDIINMVRPSKNKILTFKQIETITKNIQMLKRSNIPVIIQTVMTKFNINELNSIYAYLVELGIERWYISAVKYSDKCENNYNDICLDDEELNIVKEQIENFNSDKINITFSVEKEAGAKSRLFVEKSGRFFVDTIVDGIIYVGKDYTKPTKKEILSCLDVDKHYDLYINKKNIVNRNEKEECKWKTKLKK